MNRLIHNNLDYYYTYKNINNVYQYTFFINDNEEIIISNFLVCIHHEDDSMTATNINPSSLFPNSYKLNRKQLSKILDILENIKCEGKVYSSKEVNKMLEYWNQM